MSTSRRFGFVIIAIGVLVLVAGTVRMRTASGLREDSGELLRRQREAQAAFHQAATEISERYHAGKLDEAGWRRETENVRARLTAESDASATAWGDQLALANRTRQQGLMLLLAGGPCAAVGLIIAARSKSIAQPGVQRDT